MGFRNISLLHLMRNKLSSPPDEKQTFEEYFLSTNTPKEKKPVSKEEYHSEKKEKKVKEKKEEQEESEKEDVEPFILEVENTIDNLMKLTKCTREEVLRALYGCTGNIKHAYLFLMDNQKYEKYF